MYRLMPFVALVALGCGGTKDEEKVAPTPGSSNVGSQAAPAAAGVKLFVDGTAAGTITAAQVASWPRLDTLLPEDARRLGKWQAIATKTAAGKTSELAKPFETYRDFVPALFPGEGTTISFGLFDPVELGKRGKPALREDNISELAVKLDTAGMRGGNDHQGGEVVDPAKLELVIKTPKAETKLTGTKLLEIAREAMPGGGGDAKGWKLPVILAAAGVKDFKKVVLFDAGGNSIPLENKDLDANTIPFVKLNRQGSLRFRLYKKQGDGWQPGGDLRSLVRIEVTN